VGNGVEQLKPNEPLVVEGNPFDGAGARWVASPVRTALEELIRQIDYRRRLIVVAGKAGTGKTLLTDLVVRVCSDRGLLTCRIDRGDLADVALRATSDVVVVDEAGSIMDPTVQAFLSPDCNTATTCVFLCLPTAVHRFCCPDTYVVDLHSLSRADARTYLLERAKSIGHPHLFAPDALDLVIYRARGSFRLLRSIASLAFFDAAHEGARQIAVGHVAYALEAQMGENVDENDSALRSSIFQGDRADEAGSPQDEPVVDALETLTFRIDEGANLRADVLHSDSAYESGTDPRQRVPIGGALESPTPYVDEERIDLESDVLRNERTRAELASPGSISPQEWQWRVEYPWRRTAIRRPIGLAIEPIPVIGTVPYRLSARMRETSDDPVSPVKSVGQELREERERQGKQLDDVWRALQIRPNYLAAIEEGRFEELPGRAFTLAYVGRYERYLQLGVENLLERLEAEIGAQDSVVNHRIDVEPHSDRRIPVIGIAIASLLLGVLIYSWNGVVSFITRTFEQTTEEGLARKLVSDLVPSSIEQQTQVEAPESPIPLPFEVAATQLVSLRSELFPPIPQIAVTGPVSLRADLAPAAIRQALNAAAVPVPTRITVTPPVSLRAELLPQRGRAQVSSGRQYGLQNLNSRITLRVHRPTIVAIRDARNRIFIDRKLASGDTYRVPNLVGLWLTAIDASAIEIILDGASIGFTGAQGAAVRDLSLNPQSIADRARHTSSQAGSTPVVQAGGDR